MKLNDEMYDEIFTEKENKREVITLNKNSAWSIIYDWFSCIFPALICVVLLLTFAFRLIKVDGTSMESTLIDKDRVVVTNIFYTPKDGDIVVISHGEEYAEPLIKRVIATEGQTLKIDFENGEIYVDGVLLNEDYIQGQTIEGDAVIPEVIPEGKVFVLGDNRTVSLDSRYQKVGLIDASSIIGKAQIDLIPHTYDEYGQPRLDFGKVRYLYD